MRHFRNRLWLRLALLALLSPIGILVPKLFRAEDAWGEWGTETLLKLLGYVPKGLERATGLWNAPFPDYSVGWMSRLLGENGSYAASALVGGLLAGFFAYVVARLCAHREK
jgi:hypothetical protein